VEACTDMAEAHAAVAFTFQVRADGMALHVDNDAVAAIGLSILRSWRLTFSMLFNTIRSSLFPATYVSLFVTVFCLMGFTLAEFQAAQVTRAFIRSHLHFLPPAVDVFVTGFLLWLVFAVAVKTLLKVLLIYNGFMYDAPKRPTWKTAVWFLLLKMLAVREPHLNAYQAVLPRLPLPSVADTLKRYLKSVEPLLSPERYAELKKESDDFGKNLGPQLQRYLWVKRWWSTNYVSDWWEQYVYLYGRSPLMVNSNYYGLDLISYPIRATQAARAANIVVGMLHFRSKIVHETLRPLMVENCRAVCSAQYERAFDTTRVPGVSCDTLRHLKDSTHIAVYNRGRWFSIATYYKGVKLPATDLEAMFNYILNSDVSPLPGEEKMAAFTAWKRDLWAEARETHFLKNPTNRKSLDVIETAAFVLILDDVEVAFDDNDYAAGDRYVQEALFGKGYNKWFDKSMTITIFKNSRICVNAEHTWGDAPICCQAFEFSLNMDLRELGYDRDGHTLGASSGAKMTPVKLQWDFSAECLNDIEVAAKDAQLLIEDTDVRLLKFSDFGKGAMKKMRVSPDGFIQLALQLAYFRDTGEFNLTYEASMTRLFCEGRTETVRSCTTDTCTFVRAMEEKKDKKTCKELLKRACDNHQMLYRDAMAGKGVDRHLFCLYVVAKYLKKDHESEFLQKVLSEPWRLSTSQTPQSQMGLVDFDKSPEFASPGGGFGPVASDGYGVAYVICGDHLLWFHISSTFGSLRTDSNRFRERIRTALFDMKTLYDES
jgi:carnitine O-palmitoyltransferase 1